MAISNKSGFQDPKTFLWAENANECSGHEKVFAMARKSSLVGQNHHIKVFFSFPVFQNVVTYPNHRIRAHAPLHESTRTLRDVAFFFGVR